MDFLILLKKLDKLLRQKETLIICGGMAVTLAFGGKRQTQDIDVIAPVPLSEALREHVKKIAQQEGISANWLNDSCKGYGGYLPAGWMDRLIPIHLGFKKLKLYSLGRPDILMLKFKAARERDLADIQFLGMGKKDVQIILKNLDSISKFDSKTAMNIRLRLEEWKLV